MEPSQNCNVRRKRYLPGAMFGPFSFINVFSEKAVMDLENGMKNMVEIAVAFRIMQLLNKECESSKHKINMAVLSPHPAQVKCIREKLENNQQNSEFFKVRVGCVHDYQRGEADVVIISTVGADEDKCNFEVNTNPNNIEAYLSWAKHCLWILGDERMHLQEGSIWKSLILEAKARECFFQAYESKDLAKVVFEVQKDLHQIDELLSGESTLFQNTTWKVFFSSMFSTSFSKIESSETKKLVLLMLLKLSGGWRPKRSSNAASVGNSSFVELIKEFKVKGLHLICTIDIKKETHYTQVLRVWDILPFHEIAGLVRRLEEIIGMYTREYIEYCKARCVQRGSEYREYPTKWLPTSEIIKYKPHANRCDEMFKDGVNGKACIENAKVGESLILMKFYPLSSRDELNTIIYGCDGGDLGIPFELTEQEKNVVSFDKSCFVLGRSGTGKTTVLTMKLFQNEQLHHLACEGFHEVMESKEEAKNDVLRQLFVTFSSKLCYAIQQQFCAWKRLTCGGGSSSQSRLTCVDDIDEMMLSEDIPDRFINLPQDVYPLIITFHRFLLMLDGTVGTSYFERFPNVRHFMYGNKNSTKRLNILEQFMRFKDVTYERFCSSYWPHFNCKLKKNLDPSIVYTEIISVIKGGLATDKSPNGILARDDYVALSDGRTSIFDDQRREFIYSIFLRYEDKKLENGSFDLADLVNDLHQRLKVEGYTGDIMDYVYIDEVQDLSMSQIMLFKYLCKNVHEGFTFSGDTAQAIAKGIGFRFEDIRCLFFKKFLLGSEKGNMSKIFQLSENFRTHAGVLNLAQSVIDILCHFFPLFVDALRPEMSRINGDIPIMLETDTNNTAIKLIFKRNGDCSKLITGFGAEQVVLVRDESLKEKVLDIVGKNALVLTIMESKGLEFQDVLLYDFFTTSSFSNEWRIIYTYMKDKDLLTPSSTTPSSCFDMQKHAVLCSELKQLYVAITRSRQRLWFCESAGFSEPIYDYWKKLSLVEVKHLSDSFAAKMQTPSSDEEWSSRGVKLFRENNFRMAQMCFLKAGDNYSEKLAEAYHLRAIAGNAWILQSEKEKYLKDAAELFSTIGKKELAAECFFEIEDYKTAGDIYKSESKWEKAGNCFYLARCYELAVEEYEKAGDFANCFSACTDGKLFEIGFSLLGRRREACGDAELKFLLKGAHYYFLMKDNESMMKFVCSFSEKGEMRNFLIKRKCFDELISLEKEWGNFEEALKVMHKGAHYYFSIKDIESMMKYVHGFYDKDDMRNFLIENRCFDELIMLEKGWGNFEEAAKVARMKPDPVLEADLLQMSGLHRESSLIILWHVFSNSPIFQEAEKQFTQKDELLRKARSIAKRDSNAFYQFVSQEAEILSFGETKEELLEKGLEFIYLYEDNVLDVRLEWVKKAHEIKKIAKNVIGMMRTFFKSVNDLSKVLLLDEICGEFVEAAEIANEDRHSIEAALSRLWYVLFGSLWAYGRRAWPLKDFKQKVELLKGATSYVLDHPDSQDSALVQREIHVLSGEEISLARMCIYLREASRERSLRIHFLVSRRILDVHFGSDCKDYSSTETRVNDETTKHLPGSLLENIVSVEGLIYIWNYWKEMICELINWSNTCEQGCKTGRIYEDFLFNYFGVRKYDVDKYGGYVVLDAEAQWVKETRVIMIRNGYLYIIPAKHFSLAASRYWCSELLFVAEKVCGKLQSLHVYLTEKNLPIYQQIKILMGLFEVVKSLQKCKLPCGRKHSLIVHKYLKLCVDQFFYNVFHISLKQEQSKEMIRMRRNETFLNMLKEAVITKSNSRNLLTFEHLGRIAVVFLGHKLIGLNADTERKFRCSSLNWRALFRNLMSSDRSISKIEDLAKSLHIILEETFSASWGRVNDCMSPACFLYLMDRLLILSFCFRGYVFTTRSSFVEWLSYDVSVMGSNGGCVTSLDTMMNIHHSLTSMVNEMLNSEDELIEWLRRSEEPESLYSVLVLRLTVLLSLCCVNSGLNYDNLFRQLGRECFFPSLPHEFRVGLINGIKEDRLIDAVAVACKKIDNPLVIVSFKEDLPKETCQNAIFLNMEKLEFGGESLIEMLYLENC